MKIFSGVVAVAVAIVAGSAAPVFAASGTTCLCRLEDGKKFVENTLRHSRWACDFKLGYTKGEPPPEKTRPAGQTCNQQEIIQFHVWICMESGCTYPYSREVNAKNKGLERIEVLKGPRKP